RVAKLVHRGGERVLLCPERAAKRFDVAAELVRGELHRVALRNGGEPVARRLGDPFEERQPRGKQIRGPHRREHASLRNSDASYRRVRAKRLSGKGSLLRHEDSRMST